MKLQTKEYALANSRLWRTSVIVSERKYNGGFQRLGAGENGKLLFNGYRVCFTRRKELWE